MTSVDAKSFWITEPGRGEFRDQPLPDIQPGEVRVRALHSAISRGTETLVFRGEVPQSEFARMRAPFQEGDFPGPVKYGYINVGIIEAGPESLIGRHAFCLFPHQSHYVAPVSALHVLPAKLPPARAVLAANLETALNALWDAEIQRGETVSVIGAGALGCLCAWLAREHFDADVELIDINLKRAAIADKLGVDFSSADKAQEHRSLIIHTSASERGLQSAIDIAAFEARIIELSWYGTRNVTIALGGAFHSQRLRIIASQVGHIAAPMRGHASYRSRLDRALRLLDDPALDHLIDSSSRFEELPDTLHTLAYGNADTICHRIDYE